MAEDRYETDRRAFDLKAPADYNWAFDTFDTWATDPSNPSSLAMLWVGAAGERRLTFDDFRRRSNRAANALELAGVGRGDRVFIMLARVPEWWELMLACIRLGAVAMPATTL